MSEGRGAPTLYRADLSDPRARAAQPREAARGRAAKRAEETSDVTRFRGVLLATVIGAAAAAAAALLLPPPGGHGSAGPLSRPHVRAGLECKSCHAAEGSTPSPAQACTGCHGPHGSARAGHQRLLAAGAMTCATCHPIHQGDQGVALRPEGAPIRFAPGVEAEVELDAAFRPGREATVALVTAGSCAGCHDLAAPRDPVARCLPRDLAALGDARPVTCFDEHQLAVPDAEPARARRARLGEGVCRAQHTEDRALAWAAAREIAHAAPTVPGAIARVPAQSLAWAGAGLGAAGLALAAARGGRWLRDRRRKKAAPSPLAQIQPPTRVRLPQIDTATCLGCYACVDACPYDVLSIERYVAVVARPEACCGLILCEQRCPNGSLKIADGEAIGERPRLDDGLESQDVPGLYLAGDVTGLPLIKNAIHQGALAAERAAASLTADRRRRGGGGAAPLDLIIVGAGPAGISAALRAKELGLSFEVIEQGSVAQSIRSFPRGKLVFDQPLDLPVAGKLWLKESTKEELLAQWLRIVRQERLPILEETRMANVARDPGGDGFVVVTEPVARVDQGERPRTERRARRVVLAIGQRGSPRKLPVPIPAEIEDRVYYHLADARSLAGQRVLVVGLGDVAMEAAVALSRQPGTTVTIAARGDGFRRGRPRNIDEVKRLAAAGRLTVRFEAEVAGLAPDGRGGLEVTLSSADRARILAVDAVLVLIGNIPPWDILRAAGVRQHAEADRRPAPPVEEPTPPAAPA